MVSILVISTSALSNTLKMQWLKKTDISKKGVHSNKYESLCTVLLSILYQLYMCYTVSILCEFKSITNKSRKS